MLNYNKKDRHFGSFQNFAHIFATTNFDNERVINKKNEVQL